MAKVIAAFRVVARMRISNGLYSIGSANCQLARFTSVNSSVQRSDISQAVASEVGITLTDSCVKQIRKVAEADSFLRVAVDSGGCSGFQYKFELDTVVSEEDRIFERGGARVVIDSESLKLIHGSVIDYQEELIRCAFRIISNPQAEQGCSCGASFNIKL